ncbi:hypothetical protein CSAL01_12715 [Colletotrichum salicis]|uniref:Methyltransferase domain-containing protein n=1 Tax=Colletotrichum salicis TaxID=1209931 RepID=A0A135UMY4_9PEZI|nr:hypothetical protein CSAL01_12715 [Colletotrichum salicis]
MSQENVQDDLAPEPDMPGDTDSTIGNDDFSATTSLQSSIIDYRVENGRTYHRYKEGKSFAPNNELEVNRLGFAPPNDPEWKGGRVLDVGTGTGIWCIDFGDELPNADVLGFDLSATQPEFVPPNVQIRSRRPRQRVDLFSALRLHPHPRHVGKRAKLDRTPQKVLRQPQPRRLHRAPRSRRDNSPRRQLDIHKRCLFPIPRLRLLGPQSLWVPLIPLEDLTTLVTDTGFADIQDRRFIWPLNGWPRDQHLKELGSWTRENLACNTAGMIMAPMTRVHGWREEEVHVFAAEVRRDLADRGNHAYWPLRAIWARKPEASE